MIIGILKEIKAEEHRVSMTPSGVEVVVQNGHTVLVETGAGKESGFTDKCYISSGAQIIKTPEEIYKKSDMVMHVKEPLPCEYDLIREGQIIFTYLHLAANERLTKALIKSKSISIAYETIQRKGGSLPLLTPMSEVAGRMSVQTGAKYLEKVHGGYGVLLGGVPGVERGIVVVIGGGVVGENAARTASGLGAIVYILDNNPDRLRVLDSMGIPNCYTIMSNPANLRKHTSIADLVIGAVLMPEGAKAPKLVTEEMLKKMKNGAVIVDVAIDQGGCFETSKPTTHANPTYVVENVTHYCVANMPGGVPRTSTIALTNVTLPYALEIANKGWRRAIKENQEIHHGANVILGRVTCVGVADAFGIEYIPPRMAFER